MFVLLLTTDGFRKLRTDPILTSDVDPRTACYVRFYHEKFQRDKPELLHQIKRATKTDQQSKDDVDSLKCEVSKLKEQLEMTTAEYDRKLAELSYECNRRITAMNVEYDKLAAMVQRSLGGNTGVGGASSAHMAAGTPAGAPLSAPLTASHALLGGSATGVSDLSVAAQVQVPDLLHSLSQAAVSLQTHLRTAQQQQLQQQQQAQQQAQQQQTQQLAAASVAPAPASTASGSSTANDSTRIKRPAPEDSDDTEDAPEASRARLT